MSETLVRLVSRPAGSETAWGHTLDPYRPVRRPTREVHVGDIGIGGRNPVRVQSMTISDTQDTDRVVDEIESLARAGSEIVRVTAPNRSAAENLGPIKAALERRGVRVPLVADIHFTPQAALIAAQHVEKVRVNPGNFADRKRFEKWEYTDAEYQEELERLEAAFRPLVLRCKERGVAMRIGTNHGSLSDRILNRYGDTPLGMVESALEFVRICEHHGYREIVLSMKASDVKVMIEAYRLLASRMRDVGMDYPFHLGVTEAGSGAAARIKSAAGIVSLLADGIGDTVRVSLTEDSVHELPVARVLAHMAAPWADEAPAAPAIDRPPPWDPVRFARRATTPIGTGRARLAADQPPRIEIVVRAAEPATLAAVPSRIAGEDTAADLVLVAVPEAAPAADWLPALRTLGAWLATRDADAAPAVGIEIPAGWIEDAALRPLLAPFARVALTVDPATTIAPEAFATLPPVQYTVHLPAGAPEAAEQTAAALSARLRSGDWAPGAVALAPSQVDALPHVWRRFLAGWNGAPQPVVLRGPRHPDHTPLDAHATIGDVEIAGRLGALLADGVGDAVQLEAGEAPAAAGELARELLQATRLRISKADFIACPSCGRTQFDLQSTTARIQARLAHLKGLKIAVMGCIVNGPGEMADADFGYVGSGPGRIDLYVGHERVERNVPQAQAVERLVALIREHGRWIEPEVS